MPFHHPFNVSRSKLYCLPFFTLISGLRQFEAPNIYCTSRSSWTWYSYMLSGSTEQAQRSEDWLTACYSAGWKWQFIWYCSVYDGIHSFFTSVTYMSCMILLLTTGNIKRICETDIGLVSQCCRRSNVFTENSQILANIAIKINAKVNLRFASSCILFYKNWQFNMIWYIHHLDRLEEGTQYSMTCRRVYRLFQTSRRLYLVLMFLTLLKKKMVLLPLRLLL